MAIGHRSLYARLDPRSYLCILFLRLIHNKEKAPAPITGNPLSITEIFFTRNRISLSCKSELALFPRSLISLIGKYEYLLYTEKKQNTSCFLTSVNLKSVLVML